MTPGHPAWYQASDQQPGRHIQQRVADQEPDHPDQQADELDEPDDPFRGPVHRGPPHRRGERVGVVDLGVLLARECRAYDDHLFLLLMPSGEGTGDGRKVQAPGRPARHQAALCPPGPAAS